MRARPPAPNRLRPAARLGPLALLCALVLSTVPAWAQAPGGGSQDERNRRDDARARAQELGRELDVLKASDTELQAELTRLQRRLDAARRDADAAAAASAAADAARAEAADNVGYAEQLAETTRARLASRAVAAYVQPREESLTAVLAADDPIEFGRRKTLAATVTERDAAVLDEHRAALAALEGRRADLERATVEAAARAEQARAALAEIEALVARQREVRAALDARIADIQHEADALAAEEARLTALILSREAAARPVPTTTTAAPTTTASPSTAPTTTRPGAPPTSPTTTARPSPTTTAPQPPPSGAPPYRSLLWPADGPVTSGYGPRWGRIHQGIDIGGVLGAPVRAVNPGTVIFAGVMGGYGNVVLIDHVGYVTLYAHLDRIGTSEGARVGRGQTIGALGNTGHSTGPHLHFEVRIGGVAVDPRPYLP